MTAEKKIPTYRKGDIVLCKGRVTESVHDDSVYVKFGESGECPQLCAADIAKVVRHAIAVGNRVSWSEVEHCVGEVLAVNPDPANDKIWLWIKEDGKWPRLTVEASEVTRL
ncbi:hypothetical protein EOB36_20355 [Mesorhizobium sp. M6A.T.Cr.TU.017.01.1.1]|uniref:hypothetical protein n=1 Tax=Mesorhizobium sp. M6A.T.Cr.TU.017.01.1.1 TaxID=2496774 RepID=UPI000FD209F7|nr:hypothetical protein [Mesorhizobium sp. M6A.T.Cr.TU.017.01.1.1]RUU99431.1 hypothetical protein EOB36_20355 [Mesorhizobium sp. M6A.T.Cr.TU.017.01.1.1]